MNSPGSDGAGLVQGAIEALAPDMESLLTRLIRFESISGREGPITRFLSEFAVARGLETDLWQGSETDVAAIAPLPPRHIPLTGRPSLVLRLPGCPGGKSLIFNAHSDVVPAPDPECWRHPPFSGTIDAGRLYGRGACDTKGPLVSALWAMLAIKHAFPDGPPGDVLLEIIPGEEDCVGLGTLTSIARGWHADAAVILEPTCGLPRCASRAGCRFEITATGRAVHGTVKWLGIDAIASIHHAQSSLSQMEARWNDRSADPLFAPCPIARPMTLDRIEGGRWQGMVCDRCTCAGYLELLPSDDIQTMQRRFRDELLRDTAARGVDASRLSIEFSEVYPGHRTDPAHPLCAAALQALDPTSGAWSGWSAFNSGCEAGIRWKLHGTPTLVWGPGDLALAHAADESVGLAELRAAAASFARLALRWASAQGNA